MRKSFHWKVFLLVALVASGASGCQLLSQIPQKTWKLNQGPALDESQGYFSIPDPVSTDD